MRPLLPALLLVCVAGAPVADAQTAAPGTPVLSLSAPVGASVELRTSSSSRLRLGDVKVSALPGKGITQADLNRLRNSFNSGQTAQTTTVTGKAFVKVAARGADGAAILVTTIVQNVAGQAGQKVVGQIGAGQIGAGQIGAGQNGAGPPPITVRISQTVAPSGEISDMKIESDDLRLKAVFAQLTPEKIGQMLSQNGSSLKGIYAQALVPGTVHEQTVTLDMQGMTTALFSSMAGADGTGPPQVQVSPLTMTTRTTYQGLSAQGLHTFTTRSSAQDWQVELKGEGDMPGMTMSLGALDSSSTQTFRQGGLPGPSQQSMTMTMLMDMTIGGAQVNLTMTVEQRTVLTLP